MIGGDGINDESKKMSPAPWLKSVLKKVSAHLSGKL